jgi:hypothetical protein
VCQSTLEQPKTIKRRRITSKKFGKELGVGHAQLLQFCGKLQHNCGIQWEQGEFNRDLKQKVGEVI